MKAVACASNASFGVLEPHGPERFPSAAWIFALYLLLMAFSGGGQEELGWRARSSLERG